MIVLMGVAGAGKTSVGRALSLELGWRFIDADDRHSPLSVEKMSKGIPLTDADRLPWLNDLHGEILRTLTTLEEPSRDEAVIVDARLTEEDIVTTIRRAFEV